MICGCEVSDLAFSVPPTIDLHSFCTLLSYDNRVIVTITVDSTFLSEEQCQNVLATFNRDLNTLVESVYSVCLYTVEYSSDSFKQT